MLFVSKRLTDSYCAVDYSAPCNEQLTGYRRGEGWVERGWVPCHANCPIPFLRQTLTRPRSCESLSSLFYTHSKMFYIICKALNTQIVVVTGRFRKSHEHRVENIKIPLTSLSVMKTIANYWKCTEKIKYLFCFFFYHFSLSKEMVFHNKSSLFAVLRTRFSFQNTLTYTIKSF